MVYFITDGLFTKIGTTTDVDRRLSNLQTANARELKVALVFEGGLELEKELHSMMSKVKVRNSEWFRVKPEMALKNVANRFGAVEIANAIAEAYRSKNFYAMNKAVIKSRDDNELKSRLIYLSIKSLLETDHVKITVKKIARMSEVSNGAANRAISKFSMHEKIKNHNLKVRDKKREV